MMGFFERLAARATGTAAPQPTAPQASLESAPETALASPATVPPALAHAAPPPPPLPVTAAQAEAHRPPSEQQAPAPAQPT